MAIPFHDLRPEDGSALAGYLRFIDEDGGQGIRGALFIVNARGEPVDFTFSRVDVPASFLWRTGEARRHAVASLVASLFHACAQTPALLLAWAAEVHPRLFTEDIRVEIPLCRIAEGMDAIQAADESPESLMEGMHVFWLGAPPAPDSVARRLLDALVSRQLVLEPFERTVRGIGEAFEQS